MNFTVVIPFRARLGNADTDVLGESTAPFVGRAESWRFDCPSVDANQMAVLLFQTYGVSHRHNHISVNGVGLAGGIPLSVEVFSIDPNIPIRQFDVWASHVLVVKEGVLRSTGNALLIESRDSEGGTDDRVDDFIVDNAVVFFKTKLRPTPILE